jgi:hypothetical protein
MRSPITCCFTSPLKPLMLRLIIVTSCSSSNSSLVLLSLWYRLLAASSVRCCSRVRLPLPPTILLLWCCHVGVLLLFPHSRIRIGIVLLVLLLVCRILCWSILRSSSDILLHLGVRGIGEVHHLFCLAHIFCLLLHVGFWGFG